MRARLLPALLLVATAVAGGDEYLDGLARSLAEVKSLAASFEQVKTLKLFTRPVKSRGRLLFERPDRLRWEIREPFHSLLVVDGDKVAKFEWVDGERRQLSLGRAADPILIAIGRLRRWLTGEFDDEAYEITVRAEPERKIVLVPRDEALRRSVAALEFFPAPDGKSMRKVVVREPGGDVTVISFSEIRIDPDFPDGTFSVTDPIALDGG